MFSLQETSAHQGPLEFLGPSGNLQGDRVGLQKRRAGAHTQGCPRLLAFKDPGRGDREVRLSVTLPTQSDGKGEGESRLMCFPEEGTPHGIFQEI